MRVCVCVFWFPISFFGSVESFAAAGDVILAQNQDDGVWHVRDRDDWMSICCLTAHNLSDDKKCMCADSISLGLHRNGIAVKEATAHLFFSTELAVRAINSPTNPRNFLSAHL